MVKSFQDLFNREKLVNKTMKGFRTTTIGSPMARSFVGSSNNHNLSSSRVVVGMSSDHQDRSLPSSPMRTRDSSVKKPHEIPLELRDDKDLLTRIRQRGLLEDMIRAKREAVRESIQKREEKLFQPRVMEQYQLEAHELLKSNILKEKQKNTDKFSSLQAYTQRMEAYDAAFKQIKDKEASDDVDNLIRNLRVSNEVFNEKGKLLSELSDSIAALQVKVDNSRKEMVDGLVYSAKLNNRDKQAQHEQASMMKGYDASLAKLAQYHGSLATNSNSIHRVVSEELFFWAESMVNQYGVNKLLPGLGQEPGANQDLIRTKSPQELLGAMESVIHRLITYEYMTFGGGSQGIPKMIGAFIKEETDEQQPDTDAEDGHGKLEESELNMHLPAETTRDITGSNQKLSKLISQIGVDDLDSVEINTEHNYHRRNNKLLDLAKLRKKNKDFFDEDTLVSILEKKQKGSFRPILKNSGKLGSSSHHGDRSLLKGSQFYPAEVVK